MKDYRPNLTAVNKYKNPIYWFSFWYSCIWSQSIPCLVTGNWLLFIGYCSFFHFSNYSLFVSLVLVNNWLIRWILFLWNLNLNYIKQCWVLNKGSVSFVIMLWVAMQLFKNCLPLVIGLLCCILAPNVLYYTISLYMYDHYCFGLIFVKY